IAIAAVAGALVGPKLARGGLRPCDRLDERLCRDLGLADCELWKAHLGRVGSASVQPHPWRANRMIFADLALHKLLGWDASKSDNPLCYDELGGVLYPKILAAVRGAVAAEQRRARP